MTNISGTSPILALILIAFSATSLCAGDDTFEQRAEACLSDFASTVIDWENGTKSGLVRDSHAIAQAKFAIGETEEAREIIARSLAISWEEYYDPEFPAWAMIDGYLRWKDVPDKYEAASDRTRQTTWKTFIKSHWDVGHADDSRDQLVDPATVDNQSGRGNRG